jgi:hypothetical protein
MAKESGVGLFLAISAPAAVPTAPFVVTKTRGMVPSEVAKAAALQRVTRSKDLLHFFHHF